MKYLVHITRFIVGVLFIISGLIKLNDPVGLSFKLEEYFSETVLNLPFLQPFALYIALFVIIAEVLLGVLLLLGYKRTFTLTNLYLLILFFTFLTFYSAYYDKVTDCGCFGDAIKLTPWQSFTKDVVLLILILILIIGRNYIKPLFKNSLITSFIVAISLVFSLFLGYYVINHLPVIDFRAYKLGVNIPKGMEIPEDKPKPIYDIKFVYNVNGENKEFGMDELNQIPEGATFVERIEKLVQKGYQPPIYNFTIEKDGTDFKDEIFEHPKVLMVTAYDLSKSNENSWLPIKNLAETAELRGYKVIGLTSSSNVEIEMLREKYQLPFDFFFCDGTTVKTIERANPSVVKMEYGTILEKRHWKDIEKLSL